MEKTHGTVGMGIWIVKKNPGEAIDKRRFSYGGYGPKY